MRAAWLTMLCLLPGLALGQPAGGESPPPADGGGEEAGEEHDRPLPRTPRAREIRSLIRALGDPKWDVREAARERLLEIGPEAEPWLERAARDADAQRAETAASLLEALRWRVPDEVRALVGTALDDFPSLPREERLRGIAQLMTRPHEAVAAAPFLLTVVRYDAAPEVRQGAAEAYLAIAGPSRERDAALLAALVDEPPGAKVAFLRARLHERLDDLPAAIAALGQAMKQGLRGREQVILLLDLLLRAERAEEALALAQRAEQLAPDDLELRVLAGEALLRLGRLDEGQAKLASVLEAPDVEGQLAALTRVGRAYLRCGLPDEAERVFRRALGRFPYDRPLNVALGDVLAEQGRSADALAVYLAEIRYAAPGTPGHDDLRERIGRLLREAGAGWLAEDEAFFVDAYRGRRLAEARLAVGRWLGARRLHEEAAAELRAACALAPTWVEARLALGDALRDAGDFEGARAAYEAAQALAPKAPQARARLFELRSAERAPQVAGEETPGFASWERRLQPSTLARAPRAVSLEAPAPLILGERVIVPAPGATALYALSAEDGRLAWAFVPEPPPPAKGVAADQLGLEPVALVAVAPGTVAALAPARARSPRPVLAALYDLYWRPAHRTWRKARFRALLAYLLDPEEGRLLGRVELTDCPQVVAPWPVARRGRALAVTAPTARRRELTLLDLVTRRAVWRADVPAGLRRPLLVGPEDVLVAWDRGLSLLGGDGRARWTHERAADAEGERAAAITADPVLVAGAAVYGTGEGELVRVSLADGAATSLARPGQAALTGALAAGAGRVFAAERGGAIHAVRLEAEGESPAGSTAWTLPAPQRVALRTLRWAGGKLFALNGDLDAFAGEEAVLQALDPMSGAALLRRPVSRPATIVSEGGLVVVASGGADDPAGLRILGARPAVAVEADVARAALLRAATRDALAEGQHEVAALIARRLVASLGGRERLVDDDLALLIRALARSNRPEQAKDVLHEAEERAALADRPEAGWEALGRELGLIEPDPPASAPAPDSGAEPPGEAPPGAAPADGAPANGSGE